MRWPPKKLRGRTMLILLLSGVGLSVALAAAFLETDKTVCVPLWSRDPGTGRWGWIYVGLGPSLVVRGGYLDALLPAQPAQRIYGSALSWDELKMGYPLPAGARNVTLFVNGKRYYEGAEYLIQQQVVKPVGAGWPDPNVSVVRCDHDPPL